MIWQKARVKKTYVILSNASSCVLLQPQHTVVSLSLKNLFRHGHLPCLVLGQQQEANSLKVTCQIYRVRLAWWPDWTMLDQNPVSLQYVLLNSENKSIWWCMLLCAFDTLEQEHKYEPGFCETRLCIYTQVLFWATEKLEHICHLYTPYEQPWQQTYSECSEDSNKVVSLLVQSKGPTSKGSVSPLSSTITGAFILQPTERLIPLQGTSEQLLI